MDQKHKKIVWMTAGLMLMASLPVSAAGLGKLTVMSTLGQPFRGEIDLLAVDKKELSSVRARFASFEAFKEAKIERSSALMGMRFSVEQKKNGDPYIKITSSKAVDEPFLDMLVELDWSAGRLVREYTVLLDPPGYGEAQAEVAPMAVPTIAPVVKPAPVVPVQAEPAAAQPTDTSENAIKPEIRASIPLDKKLLAKKEEPKVESTVEKQTDSSAYGPVKKGENLAGIATTLKPEGVSLDQMLVALFQSNKQAFVGNNMNRLKAGQTLQVPDATQIADLAKTNDASKQVRAHSADWHAYRQKLAAAVAETKPVQEEAAKQTVSGKITTAVEDKATAAKQPATDVLKLSKSEGLAGAKQAAQTPPAGGAAGKETQAMKDQLHALQEEATAKEKAIKEANQRITDLEKSIKDMKQLLTLKDQNLADLQKQAAAVKAAPVVAQPAPAPAPAPVPAPVVAKPEEPAAPIVEPKVEPVVAEKPPVVVEKPVTQPKPEPVVAKKNVPEPSLLDEVLDEPIYMGAGAGLLVLLGLLGAKALKGRRKKTVTSFEDSILTNGDLKANTVMGTAGGGKVDTGDTSFLTDFSQAGLGSIDTNEVDPIAEAEVYMAYGRDAQAEEILKEALTKDPNRHEIRLKLLEIYAGRKNLNAFEAVAGEMYAALSGQASPLWDKASEMGRALDPQNPLYAEQSKVAVVEDDASAFEKTVIVSGGTAALIASTDNEVAIDLGDLTGEVSTDTDLDFNLDVASPAEEISAVDVSAPDLLLSEPEETPPDEEVAADLGFDLDLGSLSGSDTQVEVPADIPVMQEEEPAADAGLDFGMDLGTPTVAEIPAEPVVQALDLDESAMEFDMGALAPVEVEAPVEVAEAPAEAMVDAGDWQDEVMGLDLNAGDAAEIPSVDDEVLEVTEIGNDLMMPDFSLGDEVAPAADEGESIEIASLPAEGSSLDFGFDLGTSEAEEPAEPQKLEVPDLDLSGINLDISDSASETIVASDLPDDFGSQEVSTKIDLARAYIDMGDSEGARDILQEVVKEGTAEQQEEAQKLIADLG